ncbi:MAG TPA: hypothetical protein VGK92_11630 [Gaiellales bacterium]|jgi:hypothetical protein
MGGLFLLAVLVLLIVRGLPAARRLRAALRRGAGGDLPARLLALAVAGLPPAQAEWGAAMCAELAAVRSPRARWSFAAGCLRVAFVLRLGASVLAPGRGGRGVRSLVLAAVAAVLALGLYGVVRYPALCAGAAGWAAIAAFVAVLGVHAACALALTRGGGRGHALARRSGVAGGAAIGAAWLAIVLPGAFPKELVALPLAAALLVPAAVATFVARRTGHVRAGADAALWSGLVGSLLAFAVWVSATYASDGRPYDAQLVRDFRQSGAHDLAAYAVGDTLGAALGLLVLVPLVALALGSLGARLAAPR